VFAFNFRRYIEREGFAGAGNLLTWRAVFEDVGGFRLGLSEDIDWCHRATARGHRLVYAPEVNVLHPTRSDWPALRRKWLRLTEEMFRLRPRGPAGRAAWALRAGLVLGSPLRDLPRLLRARELDDPGERARAIATLLRLRTARAAWMLRQAAGLPLR